MTEIVSKDQQFWILVFNHKSIRTKCEYYVSEDGQDMNKLNVIQLISDTSYKVHPTTIEYLDLFVPDLFKDEKEHVKLGQNSDWWNNFRLDFFEWLAFLQQKCVFDASEKNQTLSSQIGDCQRLSCRIKDVMCIRDLTSHLVLYKITYTLNEKTEETVCYQLDALAQDVYEYKTNTHFSHLKDCYFYHPDNTDEPNNK